MSAPGVARATLMLAAAGFCSAASLRLCDPLIPVFAREFDVTTGHAAQTVTAFAVAYGLFQLVYGLLGDRYGKYRLVGFAAFVCAAANFAAAMAPDLGGLIVLRAVAGAAAAGIIPLSMAWLGDNVAYEFRQPALARMLTGNIAGLIAGQLLGGIFADTLGWRGAFVLVGGLFVLTGVGLLGVIGRERGLLASDRGHRGDGSLASTTAGIRAVCTTPWARVILAVVFFEGLLVFGALTYFPAFLHQRHGLSLTAAGATVAVFGLGGLLYALMVRSLVRRLGERGMSLCGTALVALALVVVVVTPSWPPVAVAIAAMGLGYYMLHNTLQTNATQMTPAVRGTAVALFASALFIGQSIGVALVGGLYSTLGVAPLFLFAAATIPVLGLLFSRALSRRA